MVADKLLVLTRTSPETSFWSILHRGGSRGRVQGVRTPSPLDDLRFSNTTCILQKKKTMWFIGVEVQQETSAPPPKKNPGFASAT